MSECIAMAIGFVLGAGCVIVAMGMMRKGDTSSTASGSPSPQEEGLVGEKSNEREQIKKQWENFLNYSGTEDGQMPIGDE